MILEADGTPSQCGFVHSSAPFPAFVGGYGSGKTHALAMRAMRLLVEHRTDIAYYMPTYDLVRMVGFKRMREMLQNAGFTVKANSSTFTLEVANYGSILFRTMEDPDRLVGYEVGHSLCDELDTLPAAKAELIWQRVLARNRMKLKGGAINTAAVGTTPEGFRFVYEQWGRDVDRAERNGYVLYRGRTLDNKHIPAEYVNNLRSQYPAQLLEAYLNGEFVNLSDSIIRRHWFKPSTMSLYDVKPRVMGVDLAISLREGADSSAIVVVGADSGNTHVLHAESKKATFHETQNWIIRAAAEWQPNLILIEAVQYQLAAVQELMRTTNLPVVAVRPDKDKGSRLMPLASRYEQGFVYHAPANSGNGIKVMEDELTAFPNGAHDDLVDALVYAWMGLGMAGEQVVSGGTKRESHGMGGLF
jgi:predicted phage terminase large subunit-like protein